jgi:hypothetical protein
MSFCNLSIDQIVVTIYALSLSRRSSLHVFAVRYLFKMIWIDASWIVAQVIQVSGNEASSDSESVAVSFPVSTTTASNSELTIARAAK